MWWSGAGDELRALAERGIPVATRRQGRGTIPDDHPMCVGRDWQNLVFQADVLLVVGTQLDYFFGFGNFPHLDAMIQIDVHPAELGRNRIPVTVPMLGDARIALAQLGDALPKLATDDWVQHIQSQYAELATRRAELAATDAVPLHPFRLCAEVASRLDPDATVIGDASNTLMFVDNYMQAKLPGRIPSMSTLGTIGHGIGWALGAAAARPDSKVVWMVGDGSFGFNAMELDTFARHNLPLVTIIMNNNGWSATWVPLGVRHYERMAPAFDGEGFFVQTPDELGPALDAAFASSTVDRQRDARPRRALVRGTRPDLRVPYAATGSARSRLRSPACAASSLPTSSRTGRGPPTRRGSGGSVPTCPPRACRASRRRAGWPCCAGRWRLRRDAARAPRTRYRSTSTTASGMYPWPAWGSSIQ